MKNDLLDVVGGERLMVAVFTRGVWWVVGGG